MAIKRSSPVIVKSPVTATVPVKLAAEEMVWPLIKPEVIVPVPDVPTYKLPDVLEVAAVSKIVPSVSLSIVSPFWRTMSVAKPVPETVRALPVLASKVKEEALEAALLSKPEVMVTKPEIVGVAVQAVPVTVRFPPREVKLLPETVRVLSKVVAPCRVKAPGVVVEPMILVDEAPAPRVLADEEPVPRVELPDEVRLVKAPLEGVPEPIVPGAAQVAPINEEALIVPELA